MGWFWNSPSDDDNKPQDTFSHLSPAAREVLEREAPRKPSRNQVPPPSSEPKKPVDPSAYSKYGDKYADIWAHYRPLAEVEAEVRTPQMAVSDVYMSYKDRKAGISRAALENCVFEQAALHECYAGGKLRSLVGCRDESHTLERCFKSQQAFLKQLGFLCDAARDPIVDEKIQMHADRLYREQEKKEQEIAANAAAGKPLDAASIESSDKPLS